MRVWLAALAIAILGFGFLSTSAPRSGDGGPVLPPRAAPALAHPAPSVIHEYLVRIGGTNARVFLRLSVSAQLVPQVYHQIDTDGDGVVSPQEHQAWLDRYLAQMHFTIDGQPLPVGVVGASPIDERNLVVSMGQPVTVTMLLTYTLPADPPQGPPIDHHFILADGSNYVSYDEYYGSFEDDPGAVTLSHDLTQPANPAMFEAVFEQDPTTRLPGPAPTPGSAAPGAPQDSPGSLFLQQLDTFLRDPHGNMLYGAFLFLLAVGLGGVHALTPGHGKAVVAAYLVGSRGRVRDAVALGWIVTLTHTLSVVALGVVLLVISNFILPRWLQPALELGSGLLIVGLGLYLLASRVRALRRGEPLSHAHDHAHPHPHPHPHAHDHPHLPDAADPVPNPKSKIQNPKSAMRTWRDLVALGVSGGLVPCPDALAILILTVPIGQIGLGLLLVSSFSLGLAAVLILIGVLMVKARGLLERLMPGGDGGNPGWVRLLPVASAIIVMGLGILLLVEAIVGQQWV